MSERKVFLHVVTYGEPEFLPFVLQSLRRQVDFELDGARLEFQLTHNGEEGLSAVREIYGPALFNAVNLGFCGAHNQGVQRFLDSDCDALLILNPDLALHPDAIHSMERALFSHESVGMVCPLLLRADNRLEPLSPKVVDSTGIEFHASLRHFDRDSEMLLDSVVRTRSFVAGASGACVMIRRDCVRDLLLQGEKFDTDLFCVFPELQEGYEKRAPLFDEAFFAYREDAELSLRARRLGWKILFEPEAIGYHVRRVTPHRRAKLSSDINRHGVRNRFFLQILHWSLWRDRATLLPGVLVRNLIVVLAVLIVERSSLRALKEVGILWRRAWERRALLKVRERDSNFTFVQ
ncbi:MAG: glycosyltransferase family 2 protein [Bdellovibrionales bacterium]|nr:glycosyltransferase family 2 protein [Bdellovibrionales bacterium]